jgi:hypothetical protein
VKGRAEEAILVWLTNGHSKVDPSVSQAIGHVLDVYGFTLEQTINDLSA